MKKYICFTVSFFALSSAAFAGQARVISDEEIAVEMLKQIEINAPDISASQKKVLFDTFEKRVNSMTPTEKLQAYAKAKTAVTKNAEALYDESAAEKRQAEKERKKSEKKKAEKHNKKLQEADADMTDGLSAETPAEKKNGISKVPEKDLVPLESSAVPAVERMPELQQPDAPAQYDPQAEALQRQKQQHDEAVAEQLRRYREESMRNAEMKEKETSEQWRKYIEDRNNRSREYTEYMKAKNKRSSAPGK